MSVPTSVLNLPQEDSWTNLPHPAATEGLPSIHVDERVGMPRSYRLSVTSMPNVRSPSMHQSPHRFTNSTPWNHESEAYNASDDIPDASNTSHEQWDPSPSLGRSSLVSDRPTFVTSVGPSSRLHRRVSFLSRNPQFLPDSGVPDLTREIHNTTYMGGGGYSMVFCAHWERSQGGSAQVAVKILRIPVLENEYGGKTIKRLKREARVWKSLNHPNIVPLLGLVSGELGLGLVSPWYFHGNILQYIQVPNVRREPLCEDIANGLRYLHEQDPPIVHGDLKAANVVVAMDGRAALCDFGLSLILDGGPTGFTSSTIGGTIRFLAQEQLSLSDNPGSRSPSSDVYAYACTYAEIMTGEPPFAWYRTPPPIIQAICQGNLPYKIDSIVSNHDLDFLLFSWNPEPADRPTIAEICQALGMLQPVEDM